jgi:excisionase family DNA binding protein
MNRLTVEEVAAILHAEQRTVRLWTRAGHLRGCKVGRRWLYEQADVDAFIDKGQSRAPERRRRRRAA